MQTICLNKLLCSQMVNKCFYISADFDFKPVQSSIAFQAKFPTPKRLSVGFPISPGAPPKHMLTVSWLLNEQPLDSKEILALGLLDSLMLGTSSSEVALNLL
jgi:hypothetical protein